MEYIHIRSLEKYHPGYKDRELSWGKIFINMAQGDPDTEALCEIDFSRLIKMILLELRAKKPLPNLAEYWQTKGFDLKKRSISLTLQMLHNFVEVVSDNQEKVCIREEKIREDILSGKPDIEAPIQYLNEKAKTKFDPKNKSNQELVKARFNEGRTIEQFKSVVDKKVGEWLSDEKMSKYLRPSTLFSRTNFENYINEPIKPRSTIIFKKEQ